MFEWIGQVGELIASFEPFRPDLLARLLLAAFLGGAVGIERELQGKPAGLRTNMLICLGAALLTDISVLLSTSAAPGAVADPARIAAQIVTGVGFLGAGTIIQARGHVTGLTTAATLWVVAAVGIAVGARAYVEALGATALILIALIPLRYLEDQLLRRRHVRSLRFTLMDDPGVLDRIEQRFAAAGIQARCTEVERRPEAGVLVSVFESVGSESRVHELLPDLIELDGVRSVVIE
ncbi:MAG: MgtC/SapB family protein [Gemmatimonadetes bacterium]|nr:MgtC/SapB family protein [Gemmatimonadota bacterium]